MNLRILSLPVALAALCAPAYSQPEAPAPAAPKAPAAPATANAPDQIVEREFASYDIDKSGQLDATEFTAWVTKLRKPAADGSAPADSQNWSAGLFTRADVDKNQLVSKTEMTTLLTAARG